MANRLDATIWIQNFPIHVTTQLNEMLAKVLGDSLTKTKAKQQYGKDRNRH